MPVSRLVGSREDTKPDARLPRLPGVIFPRQWLFGVDTT
jgi:hypothetical protein